MRPRAVCARVRVRSASEMNCDYVRILRIDGSDTPTWGEDKYMGRGAGRVRHWLWDASLPDLLQPGRMPPHHCSDVALVLEGMVVIARSARCQLRETLLRNIKMPLSIASPCVASRA
jgi:hypothetical protein